MKPSRLLPSLIALLVIAQLACNYASVNILAEPSATPIPPTATYTLPPPTFTPLPPTATFTLPPPPTSTPPPAVQPVMATVPTNTPVPTLKPTVHPMGHARLSGTFPGGEIVFRVNDAGTYVTLKEITVNGIQCGSKKVNKHMTFESISFFEIVNGEFSFTVEQATVSGMFDSATTAHGSVSLEFNVAKTTCKIGPFAWSASGAAE